MSESKAGIEQPEPRPSGRRHTPPFRRGRNVYYTDAEWQVVEEAALLCGKSVRRFIRETSLGVPVRARRFLADAELIRELGKSGLALARLAATARESGALPLADNAEAALAELRALVRRIASPQAASGARC
jgi:hypothetical protein